MKTDFEVMNEMTANNQDLAMFPDVVGAKKVKAGFQITIGVPESVGYAIAAELATGKRTHYLALYRINKEQFDKIKDR